MEKTDLKNKLTNIQYEVTQKDWTERAFDNEYWDNEEEWIYVDIVDWTPLFSSYDKFDSWTWWPSFTKPIDENSVTEHTDTKFFMSRTEVRSTKADSHLGHVFPDGPTDEWWMRYCMNSASLNFVPRDELEGGKYDEYKELFK